MNKQLFYTLISFILVMLFVAPVAVEADHKVKPSIKCDDPGKIKINLSLPDLGTKLAVYKVYKNGVYVRSTTGSFKDTDPISADQGPINYKVEREEKGVVSKVVEEVKVDPKCPPTQQAAPAPDWLVAVVNFSGGVKDAVVNFFTGKPIGGTQCVEYDDNGSCVRYESTTGTTPKEEPPAAAPAQPAAAPAGPNNCWPWDIDCICRGNPQGSDLFLRRCPATNGSSPAAPDKPAAAPEATGICISKEGACADDYCKSLPTCGSGLFCAIVVTCNQKCTLPNTTLCLGLGEKNVVYCCTKPTDSSVDQYNEILNQPVTPLTPLQKPLTIVDRFNQIVDNACSNMAAKEQCLQDAKECEEEFLRGYSDPTCIYHAARKLKSLKEVYKDADNEIGFLIWRSAHCAEELKKLQPGLEKTATGDRCVQLADKCGNERDENDGIKCIVNVASSLYKPPTRQAPIVPVAPPPALVGKVSDEFISALGAWCSVQCGEDKKAPCQDQVGSLCEKQADFKKCIEDEAKKLCPGLPPKQKFTPPKPAASTLELLINGLKEASVPITDGQFDFGTKLTRTGSSGCIDSPLVVSLTQTHDANRALPSPKIVPLYLTGTSSCKNYTYKLNNPGFELSAGKYILSARFADFRAQADLIITGQPEATTTKLFSCQTEVKTKGPDSIEAFINIPSDVERPRAYNRVNWFINNGGIKLKGTNLPGQAATFGKEDGVKPNSWYQIQAQYYSDLPEAERKDPFFCFPRLVQTPASGQSRVKSTPKQLAAVLGAHTSPISFDVLPIVTPQSIVAVNVRVVTLDLEGNPSEVLFPTVPTEESDGRWENGRPLPLTINNPSLVSAVRVTVEEEDTTIPISKTVDEVITLLKAAPQNIELTMGTDNEYTYITFTASTAHPVDNPKFIVNDTEQDPADSTCDQSGDSCVYSWTAYAPFSGSYNVSFGDKSVQFNPEQAAADQLPTPDEAVPPATGEKVVTKITISKAGGADEQVIYTRGETEDCCFAEADFDLTVGDNAYDYTVEYSDGTTQPLHFVVERQASTEGQPPATTPEQPPAGETPTIPQPQSTACTYEEEIPECPGNYRICNGTDEGSGCHYNPDVNPACSGECPNI